MPAQHPMKIERRLRSVEFHMMRISDHERARPQKARTASISEAADNLLERVKVMPIAHQQIEIADLARGDLTVVLLGQMHSLQEDDLLPASAKRLVERANPIE